MDYKSALGLDAFEKFASASSSDSILTNFNKLCQILEIRPTNIAEFLPVLQETLTSPDARDLLAKYDRRVTSHKCYAKGRACVNSSVLVIGAGPCGLRTAIEAQLLGARVVVIEKRPGFTRKNVLHLWPFVMTDLKELGAKRFCPKFCSGSIDHVSINQLQSILLKIALILGVEVHTGVEFRRLVEPTNHRSSWTAATNAPPAHPVHDFEFDVVIGADGRQNVLPGFSRKELRGKLAIAITANFLNRRTAQEAKVQEISGVSFIFRQSLFLDLYDQTGIDLENIVYYKDETHYFVMTAKKQSLLSKGVLRENYADTLDLLAPENVDMDALQAYTIEAVRHVTQDQLPNLEFALNPNGLPDLAIFDFTKMYAAENSCRVLERRGCRLLMGLVGDSLLEPFWPTGSGCARGFLSSLDAAWMIRSWARGQDVLEVLAERETIYRLLGQTTHDNLSKDYKGYAADPTTRYPNLVTGTVQPSQLTFLVDSDSNRIDVAHRPPSVTPQKCPLPVPARRPKQDSDSREVTAKVIRRTGSVKTSAGQRNCQGGNENQKRQLDVDFLVDWFRQTVEPYEIQVHGIHDIFVRGDVLCATIHSYRPDLIPEYPFPPEIEEGIDVSDAAAFRNQIAFDFLNDEYQLPYVVSGYDSVQYTMTHLEELVFYLFQVYSIFRNYPEVSDQKSHVDYGVIEPTPMRPKMIQRSATFSVPGSNRSNNADDTSEFRNGRCIRKLQEHFQGLHFRPAEPSEDRVRRKRDAEKCKLKALEFISLVQERKSEEEKEALDARRDRIVKTIRAVHVTEPGSAAGQSGVTRPPSSKQNDDFFNEYNLRLWRKSVPSMEERMGKLENAFGGQLPPSSTKEAPVAKEVRGKSLLKRAKSTASAASLTPASAPKVNTKDWVLEVLAQKFQGAGHAPSGRHRCPKSELSRTSSLSHQDGYAPPDHPVVDPIPDEIDLYEEASNKTGLEFTNTGDEEEIGTVLDKVPERAYYSAQDDYEAGPSIQSRESPLIEFNEADEDLLDQLDPSDLEHLEAWTGKYL